MFYFIYGRMNVHVGVDDATLMAALDEYADGAIKGGAAVLTQEHRDAIRKEHADARELYGFVMRGA